MTRNRIAAVAAVVLALTACVASAPGDAPMQLPPPAPAATPAHHTMTHQEFAEVFRPAEGKYEITLLHPKTCCPVTVCFCLPCGCPKKVRVHKYSLTFDYGRDDITIRFKLNGDVYVRYH